MNSRRRILSGFIIFLGFLPVLLSLTSVRAEEKTSLAGAWISRARLHENLGEYREAVRFLAQALTDMGDSADAFPHRLHLAELYCQLDRYPEAAEIFIALRGDPRFRAMLRRRDLYWTALRETGGLEEELERLAETIRPGLEGIATRLERVEIFRFAGRFDEAVAEYDAVVAAADAAGMGMPYRLSRARLLEDTGRTAAAIAEYRTLLAASPHDSGVRERLGRLLCQTGEEEEGDRILRGLLQGRENQVGTWLQLARILQELSRFSETISVLREGMEATGQELPFLIELAAAYEVQLQTVEAAEWYRRALAGPRAGEARQALQRMAEADESAVSPILEVLGRRGGEDKEVRRDMEDFSIRLAADSGRLAEALELAERYAANWGPDLLLEISQICRMLGKEELARQGLRVLAERFAAHTEGRIARCLLISPAELRHPAILAELQELRRHTDPRLLHQALALLEESARLQGNTPLALEYRLERLRQLPVPLPAALEEGAVLSVADGRPELLATLLEPVPERLPVRSVLQNVLAFFADPDTGGVRLREAVIAAPELYHPELPLSLLFLREGNDPGTVLDYFAHRLSDAEWDVLADASPVLKAWVLRDRLRRRQHSGRSFETDRDAQVLLRECLVLSPADGALEAWRRLEQLRRTVPEAHEKWRELFVRAFPDSPLVHLCLEGNRL